MVNFGPLTAEIGWRVWGTPANFNEFSVLALLKVASSTDRNHLTLSVLTNKTVNIILRNWNQFLLLVKATSLKQQISKFCTQILSTEVFYNRSPTDINVIAGACALNFRIKFWFCCFRAVAFTTKRNWFQFCLIMLSYRELREGRARYYNSQ